jgi:hypothetical protein
VALTDNPKFPTYPHEMSQTQVSAGLAAAFAASTLLGKSEAVALLITLFMAVTSCASAELIAVSSILTFDIYKTYIKPSASPESLVKVAHINVGTFGLTIAIFAIIWNTIGIDLGWLFLVMGLLIGGAVFPVAFAITWKKQTKAGALLGALTGLAAGITAWIVEAKVYYGELSVKTTGMEYPTLAGNLAAIMTGLIVSVVVSLVKPDDFDWEITRAINAEGALEGVTPSGSKSSSRPTLTDGLGEEEKKTAVDAPQPPTERDEERQQSVDVGVEENPKKLRSAFKLACVAAFVLPFIMDFLIPIPMFLSHYIFSEHFFIGWVVISFIWVFSSAAISVILPLYETAGFFKKLVGEIITDIRRRGIVLRINHAKAWQSSAYQFHPGAY